MNHAANVLAPLAHKWKATDIDNDDSRGIIIIYYPKCSNPGDVSRHNGEGSCLKPQTVEAHGKVHGKILDLKILNNWEICRNTCIMSVMSSLSIVFSNYYFYIRSGCAWII